MSKNKIKDDDESNQREVNADNRVRSKRDITSALMKKEEVDAETMNRCLQTAIFTATKAYPFFGSVLQCMSIQYNHMLPTAGIMFNDDLKRWDLFINPHFFCRKLSSKERTAVLFHEIYHVTHQHPLRVPFMHLHPQKRQLMNVAMDMAINQGIRDLPDGCNQCPPKGTHAPCKNDMCPGRCIQIEDYRKNETNKKIKWEDNKVAELYYENLCKKFTDPNPQDQDQDGEGQGQGGTGGDGDGEGEGKGKGNAGGGAQSPQLPNTIDVHNWDGGADESDVLDATEDLMKRAMVKQRFDFDQLPGSVKELLQHIDSRRAELNYKAIILSALKRSLPANCRKHSWSRKSRRFGNKAPGTTYAENPRLENFIDTSGSISIEEANEFLDIIDEFLKVGAKECNLNMFHTRNYYSEKYKKGRRLKREDFESGGTCLEDSFRVITQKRPDLTIILTDGYYSDVDVEAMCGRGIKPPQVVFIISREGTVDHPFAHRDWARTVKIPSSAKKK